jgi:hypothetical protein
MKRLKKKPTVAAAAVLLASAVAGLVANVLVSRGSISAEVALRHATAVSVVKGTLAHRFATLSRRHTNKCSLASTNINALAVGGRLQGSCCRPMVFARYAQQVRGLRAYAALEEVPTDPYDISVSLARRLIDSSDSITLSPAQQATYDQAMKLSNEHGPCCCHCWRWTAFEGQAKRLILEHRFSAAKIAAIWGLEDGCGGRA